MRLLNTKTLEFQEFFDSNLPIYAILSHRWDPVEVSYEEFCRSKHDKTGPGWDKIVECCAFVSKQGRGWVWIDTCCIDKRSSAELSEGINSMYRWYEGAVECYAYLNDVDTVQSLEKSAWFTRGFTLQELLAPYFVVFLDSRWRVLGDRTRLARRISTATGIPQRFLETRGLVEGASVAQKMSWAARRRTSRQEDRAYSLMGLFGVNMPLLYGEGGANAFRRLQLEILRVSDDESIFAWREEPDRAGHSIGGPFREMLAARPECFARSGGIVRYGFTFDQDRPPYSMTHKGLKLHVPASAVQGTSRLVLPLDCCRVDEQQQPPPPPPPESNGQRVVVVDDPPRPLAVILVKTPTGSWARIDFEDLEPSPIPLWTRRECSYPNKATIYVQPDN